ncbi:hypothetical protein D3C76_1370800 [compost metagenome]
MARETLCSPLSSPVEAKRSRPAIFSLLAKSSAGPSLRTWPKFFQKSLYFSGSFFASFSSMSSTRLVSADFIESITGSFCRISRETFSDRSLESTTPLMKRR